MDKLSRAFGVAEPVACHPAGLPTYGTCAGLIMLAADHRRHRGQQTSACSTPPCGGTRSAARTTRSRRNSMSRPGRRPRARGLHPRPAVVEQHGPGCPLVARWRTGRSSRCSRTTSSPASFHPEVAGEDRFHPPLPRHGAQRLTRLAAAVRFASMTINDWWRDRPEERYWMIAPSRGIVGDALSAPKALGRPPLRVVARAGGFTEPGDTLFVWDMTPADAGHRRVGARARAARRAAALVRRGEQPPALAHAGERHPAPRGARSPCRACAGSAARSSRCATEIEASTDGPVYFPFIGSADDPRARARLPDEGARATSSRCCPRGSASSSPSEP